MSDYKNLENFRKAIEEYVTAHLENPDSGIEELCHRDVISVEGGEDIFVTLAPYATYLVDYRTGIPILEKNIKETHDNIQNNEEYSEEQKKTIFKKYIHSLITQIKGENFKDTYFSTESTNIPTLLDSIEEEQRGKYKKGILEIIKNLKKKDDPNDEIRFNLTHLALLMEIAENENIRDLLKEEFEGKTLEDTLTEAVEEVIGYIYKLSYRSLVARPKKLTEVFYTSGGKVGYHRDAFTNTNEISFPDIYTRNNYSDGIVTTSIIKHLFEIFKKYNTSKNKDYKKTEGRTKNSFDKEMVESMISHCSRPLTSSEIEPFFRGAGERYYNSTTFVFGKEKFKIKNPVTRSIVSHANLGKDACVFVLKELNSVKNIDQADMDLLFKNKKVRETGVLYEAVKQILEEEKSTKFKQNPELLQSIITHINIFDEEKTEEIRKLIEGLIPNLVDTSVNPNLIALLIKNTDLTSLENTNKAKEVFKKIAKLDQNEFSNNFPKIKQPITIILKSFTEKFDDKNIETILLEDPSILCDAIKNKNIEIVKYCLEHKIFKPFFIKDENTKNTPIRLIESTPGEIFNKMRSLIKEKKHKTGLDDCKKQMEEEANKTKQPKPEQPKPEQPKPEQPKPEQQKPEQPKPEQPKPEQQKLEQQKPEQPKPEQPKPEQQKLEQQKPKQPETKKEEKKEQDITTLNKESMDRVAQKIVATQEAKNVLEKLNESNTGKIEEDVEEYKKIFSDLVLKCTYGMFVKTIMLTKVLEILVEKINDAQKIMLFSILACTIPEKLPEVKGIFEREAGPELIPVLKKISSKAENLCHLFKANSDMPYHKRAQIAIKV